MKLNILIVEDDKAVAEMMGMFFKKEKWQFDIARDGLRAVNMFKKHFQRYDLITLDLMLPKKDGIEVAKEVRQIAPTIPIIMLTARGSEADQVLGLGVGADEYVTKPFSPLALIARIKALHRRVVMNQVETPNKMVANVDFEVQTSHLKISKKRREVVFNGHHLQNLTPKEFDLLFTMAQKPEQVFSREQLLQLVWGYDYEGESRTVDAHIKKLRQKLAKFGPEVVKTVWGVGYKFSDSKVEK